MQGAWCSVVCSSPHVNNSVRARSAKRCLSRPTCRVSASPLEVLISAWVRVKLRLRLRLRLRVRLRLRGADLRLEGVELVWELLEGRPDREELERRQGLERFAARRAQLRRGQRGRGCTQLGRGGKARRVVSAAAGEVWGSVRGDSEARRTSL